MQAFTLENDVFTSLQTTLAIGGTSMVLRGAISPNRNPPAPLDAGRLGVLTLVDRLSSPRYIEIVTYTGRSIAGDGTVTLSGLQRGQQGTAARAWPAGSFVYQAVTRDQLQQTEFGAALGSVADAAAARALLGVGALQSVSVTSPLTSTGGATPTIGLPAATAGSAGHMAAADKAKLDGIAAGATATPLSSAAPASVGSASSAGGSAFASRSDHVHAHGNQAGGALHAEATAGAAGFMSIADKSKLDGIAAGAQVNVPTNITIGGSGDARTINSSTGTGAAVPLAGAGTAGFISQADKTKLDGVAAGATNTPLSSATPQALGNASAGASTSASRADHVHAHGDQLGGTLHATASASAAGFMSSADKNKLDSLVFSGLAGTLAFHDGAGNLSSSAFLRYREDQGQLLETRGLLGISNLLDLSTLPTAGGSAAISRYQQFISGGIASWEWTLRSEDGGGLIRMRLDSGSAGPTISFGSDPFVPIWHGANLDPSGFATLSNATPAALGSASAGAGTAASRNDHVHPMPTAAQVGAIATSHPINPVTALGGVPASVASSNTAGTSTAVARADHQHAHGDLAGGSFHATATTGAAGFMSAADKTKLDGVATGATANATDAQLRDRTTHTGSQAASTISDFAASARAQVEGALIEGANVTITPSGSGATRQFTIAASLSGSASAAGPAGAIQASNGSGGFVASGVSAVGGVLVADNMVTGEIEGGAYGSTSFRWRPDAQGNFGHGFSEASIFLQPNSGNTAGQVRLEAKQDTGSGLRYMEVAGGAAAPTYFDGAGVRTMAHGGNLRTINGQSIFGTTDLVVSGGVAGFAASINTASPNATTPAHALSVDSASANVDAVLAPKGTGSVLAAIPDGTASGGNKRGANATDLQTAARTTSAQVASGVRSVICGGFQNTSSQQEASVVGGSNNTASNFRAFVGGGFGNIASGDRSAIAGGASNLASGNLSTIPGGSAANTRGISGLLAYGFAGNVAGRNQMSFYGARQETSSATQTRATADASSASASNTLTLNDNSVMRFVGEAIARDTGNNDAKSWAFSGTIKRGSGAASVAFVGSPSVTTGDADAGASSWALDLLADSTNGALGFNVTGASGRTIRWTIVARTTEVG